MSDASCIFILAPRADAVSGVSTHLVQLLGSQLACKYRLVHFQVGSQGRSETAFGKLTRLVGAPFMLALQLVRKRATCVHINTSLEPRSYWRDLAFLCVAKILRRRSIYQVHGGALPEAFCTGNRVRRWTLSCALRAADAVVLLARVELDAYRKFAPDSTLMVIANAIATGAYAPLVDTRGSGRTPLRLVYVGRLAATKGIHDAIAAISILRQCGTPCRLTIAGSGPEEPALRQCAERHGVARHVDFIGPVFDEAKTRLWLESDLFVFPTFHWEGLPYALLESMAAGTPPITTRVGAIPDVVHDRVHGFLIEPHSPAAVAEAVAVLANDRSLLRRMGEAARQRVHERYRVERLAADFDALYAGIDGAPHEPIGAGT